MKMRKMTGTVAMLLTIYTAFAQPDRWQQRVAYKMDINFDDSQHQYMGKQNLIYTNN